MSKAILFLTTLVETNAVGAAPRSQATQNLGPDEATREHVPKQVRVHKHAEATANVQVFNVESDGSMVPDPRVPARQVPKRESSNIVRAQKSNEVEGLRTEVESLRQELATLRVSLASQSPETNGGLEKRHEMLINPTTGAWDPEELKHRGTNGLHPCVADAIATLMKSRGSTSLGDYGAGNGIYSQRWKKKHGLDVHCYDGNPAIQEASGGLCSQLDLSQKQQTLPLVDWAISLEVAEHIPKEREAAYVSNLHAFNKKGIIISWAHPGQHGQGHVNGQKGEYVEQLFKGLGYQFDENATNAIRSAASCEHHKWPNSQWFERNLFVFARP